MQPVIEKYEKNERKDNNSRELTSTIIENTKLTSVIGNYEDFFRKKNFFMTENIYLVIYFKFGVFFSNKLFFC